MTTEVIALPGNEIFATRLGRLLGAEIGTLATRSFPDGETYVRIESDVHARNAILVSTLDRPDDKTLRLLFSADAVRELGAARVGLVAPYLAYMRQDRRFKPGEAITSKTFADLLSRGFDWMVTVDPHLHRRSSMAEIYAIPVGVCHAAPSISAWIRENIANPVLIGPDVESEQWASAVAGAAGAPFTVLDKQRHGDRDVEITVRDIDRHLGRQPVLVDDIISSGRTMEAAIHRLTEHGFLAPAVVGVHGIFADDAFARLKAVGAGHIVSCNTVPHPSNAIDLSPLIAEAVQDMLARRSVPAR